MKSFIYTILKNIPLKFNSRVRIFAFLFLVASLNAKAQNQDTLQQNLIKAQTAYYQKQTQEKSFWGSLVNVLPGIIGTMIGASLALLGVRWSTNRQWKLEKEKWEKTKAKESLQEKRSAAAELSKLIAAEIQTIIWLTWIAKYDSTALSQKDIDDYNIEMKKLFKEDLIAQTHLVVLDTELYKKMKPLVKEITGIDHRMSICVRKIQESNSPETNLKAARELGEFYDSAYNFYNSIPEKLGTILPSDKS